MTARRTPSTPDRAPLDRPFELSRDAWGRLVLKDSQGVVHIGVTPLRAFPLGDPERWIAICDFEGRELVCVPDLAQIPEGPRALVVEELAQSEFVPRIRRVVKVSSYLEPAEWEAETDRGRTRFVLKTEEDVRRLGPHSALISDSQGMRYLVPDTRALDGYSRRAVERYL